MTQSKEMVLINGATGQMKTPRLTYKKITGVLEAQAVGTVTVEVLEPDPETLRLLAMYANAGHPVHLTITADQQRL